jgi:hypothetical protein
MFKVIDNITTTTGWSASANALVHGLNDLNLYIAGNNINSVIFNFNGLNSYIEKQYDEDVTNYNEITIWIYSLNKNKNQYRTTDDFNYKIDLGTGKEYYLSAYNYFYWVTIDVSDIDIIDRIRVTALHDDNDYVILSYFVASKTVIPLDIFQGIKNQIEFYRDQNTEFINIGTISGTTEDNYIEFSESAYFLDRYMTIKIDDNTNSEIHHITKVENNRYYFSNLYDGSTLLNDYTNANVYIYYPVDFGTTQKEISLPSITLWGFAPERQLITNELDNIIDSIKTDGNFAERQVGQYTKWLMLIDCEAKEEWQLLGDISQIVRNTIGQKIIWINGKKAFIDFEGSATELYPTESFDIVPKIQYPVTVSIREELYSRQSLPSTTDINFETIIAEQGSLN